MNIVYRFTKAGKTYCAMGNNRNDAQKTLEFMFHIDLTGAQFEEIYKHRILRKGTV